MSTPRTIADAAAALRAGSISSVELVSAMFERANAVDPPLGSYIARFDDAALDAARRADTARSSGEDVGPLHGVPLALKDNVAAREGPTTAQSIAIDPDWGAGTDATVTARLRATGGIIMGKTTLSEFATGVSDPISGFPVPLNPWDLSRSPGGSSSGSGSGVAAGLFLGAVGTDTGGSVRLPAHFCGITGLRPTFGLVPVDGTVPLAYNLDCVGPMARSARDCASMLTAMTDGNVDYEAALTGTLDGVRIGVFRPYVDPLPAAHEDVVACFEQAVGDLAATGATLTEVELPMLRELTDAYSIAYLVEILAYHQRRLRERWVKYGSRTRLTMANGVFYTGNDYLQAQRLFRIGIDALARVFDDVDVVVLPTAGGPATGFGATFPDGWMTARLQVRYYTLYISTFRVPAASAPMGFTAEGLPCGLQVIGRPMDDATVLRVADAYQRVTDWHLAEPSFGGEPGVQPPFDITSQGAPDPVDEATTRALLEVAGLPASDDEVAALARSYPYVREAADAVCAAGSAVDVDPVLQFQPQRRP